MNEDLRVIKTDRLIKDSLIELLNKKDFTKITIKDICDTALIGRSTFYHHYVDKYLLMETMINDLATQFQNLLDSRNDKLINDSLLIYLYKELFEERETFLTLLSVHDVENDLESRIQKILKNSFLPIIKDNSTNLPSDFLANLYASNALLAITWTLKNGHSQEVAEFMNDILKYLIENYLA